MNAEMQKLLDRLGDVYENARAEREAAAAREQVAGDE